MLVATPPLSWQDAEYWCRQHGGHLASVHSNADDAEIRAFMQGNHNLTTDDHPWIGAFSTPNNTVDSYLWSDGTPFDYQNPSWARNNAHPNYVHYYLGDRIGEWGTSGTYEVNPATATLAQPYNLNALTPGICRLFSGPHPSGGVAYQCTVPAGARVQPGGNRLCYCNGNPTLPNGSVIDCRDFNDWSSGYGGTASGVAFDYEICEDVTSPTKLYSSLDGANWTLRHTVNHPGAPGNLEWFEMDGTLFLLVPRASASQGVLQYVLDEPNGRLRRLSATIDFPAYSVRAFASVTGEHYLAARWVHGNCNVASRIFKLIGTGMAAAFIETQRIVTAYASEFEPFVASTGDVLLFVGNTKNTTSDSSGRISSTWTSDAIIYRQNRTTGQFERFQHVEDVPDVVKWLKIDTAGETPSHFVAVSRSSNVGSASLRSRDGSRSHLIVFRDDGATGFTVTQRIPCHDCTDAQFILTRPMNQGFLLVLQTPEDAAGNPLNGYIFRNHWEREIAVFRWDAMTARFAGFDHTTLSFNPHARVPSPGAMYLSSPIPRADGSFSMLVGAWSGSNGDAYLASTVADAVSSVARLRIRQQRASCWEHAQAGLRADGRYWIQPAASAPVFEVTCAMDHPAPGLRGFELLVSKEGSSTVESGRQSGTQYTAAELHQLAADGVIIDIAISDSNSSIAREESWIVQNATVSTMHMAFPYSQNFDNAGSSYCVKYLSAVPFTVGDLAENNETNPISNDPWRSSEQDGDPRSCVLRHNGYNATTPVPILLDDINLTASEFTITPSEVLANVAAGLAPLGSAWSTTEPGPVYLFFAGTLESSSLWTDTAGRMAICWGDSKNLGDHVKFRIGADPQYFSSGVEFIHTSCHDYINQLASPHTVLSLFNSTIPGSNHSRSIWVRIRNSSTATLHTTQPTSVARPTSVASTNPDRTVNPTTDANSPPPASSTTVDAETTVTSISPFSSTSRSPASTLMETPPGPSTTSTVANDPASSSDGDGDDGDGATTIVLLVAVVGFLLIAGVVVWQTRPRDQAATMAIAPPPPPYIDPSTAAANAGVMSTTAATASASAGATSTGAAAAAAAVTISTMVPNGMYESADAPTRIDDSDGSGDYEDVNSGFNTPAATASGTATATASGTATAI